MNAWMRVPSPWMGAAFGVLVMLSGGCQSLRQREPRAGELPPAPTTEFVYVGGRVAHPREITLAPGHLLTLRRALIAAGGLTPDASQGFVGLRRGEGALAAVTHFPVFLVTHGLAGDIPLRAGDEITVELASETSLATENAQLSGSTRSGEPFTIEGLVEDPGSRQIGDRVGPSQMVRIVDVLASTAPGPTANTVILMRKAPASVLRETYVFPLDRNATWDAVPTDAPIVAGDRYIYGTALHSPLLATAVLAPLVNRRVEQAAPSRGRRGSATNRPSWFGWPRRQTLLDERLSSFLQ